MKIASWNVNSIRARLPNVLEWLKSASPDVVLLQELKCMDEAFPYMEIEDLGYNSAVFGQKTYNGVAILSKTPIEDVRRGLPGDDSDEQARYIEGVVESPQERRELRDEGRGNSSPSSLNSHLSPLYRVASIYVPNGMDPASSKFEYKLRFLERLKAHAETLLPYEEKLVLGADYNCAPEALDVYDPEALRNTVCYHPEEQKRYHSLCNLGFYDAFRLKYPERQQFSWWDYRGGSFEHGKGMRIDHLLLSAQAADGLKDCVIDTVPRAREKASDHAPVVCEV